MLVTLTIIVLYAFFRILPFISDIITVVIISGVLVYAFRPLVDYFERLGVTRTISILAIFAIVLGLLVILLTSLIPMLVNEIGNLIEKMDELDFSQIQMNLLKWMEENLPGMVEILNLKDLEPNKMVTQIQDFTAGFLQQSLSVLSGAVNALSLAIVVPFLVFFMLKDGTAFTSWWVGRVPNRFFEMSMSLSHRVDRQLGSYILSVLVESVIIGVLTWLAFLIVGVRFALVLGVVGGLLNMIPFFGPLLTWIPTTIVVLLTFQPLGLGLFWMAVVLIGVQMVDNILLKPLLIGRSQSIHPVTVLLVVLIGGRVAGPIGMFIAVPFFSIIKVILVDFYEHLKSYRII